MISSLYPAWFVIQTKQNQERRAEASLVSQGIECYLPVVPVSGMRKKSKLNQMSESILFPRYLFAYFNPEVIHTTAVKNSRGVQSIVTFSGEPATLSPEQMESIRENIDARAPEITAKSYPVKGEGVEVLSGVFESLTGVYQEADGLKRSILLLDILGKKIRRSMPNNQFQFIS
ncbi:transcription/translation regulatory transformer protein RfaH [Pantoea ananatis]|uniref:transcription/translation regulatory transformer protein RfaH n=1 Tax=Pantoea ananas TaxID=553 RepID=UPI0021E99263|nr:transcription/translation regulatory transformer protein RfaH [Pantoea ananatis]MCW0309906.1 Transcription antitermination protein RfaH [Pantoea ananatis]MCW0341612.1 Transcription antitermination protein RfaH [Pantoea ananatis]MCW0360112.1 Transcription antitermination protein RfaH [Pantoea ananatis]MCW0364707.1 Transcription antitermination protein RfaH [Pantoea ananatis]MCW1777360.1 transcription/translation regulatory transformer protein RfaH [Pantoea ananatis]